ncbi:type VI secretion system tip protein TssI/VgrG [Methylobacterium sp. yr596]|uniref:type VI secretion system tip protein TssI/VgrG n=1 Tax=Methylobacterium sp. yr596 TaxID=1761800 RepID=UPI0008E70D92|nr:type VI secretion system tip protein TssI/VgrG [Methylobacterium sp. yr596]SFE64222.1 type VI secretion system secreted protein VgrG [Methylobacterium sp. yr596]
MTKPVRYTQAGRLMAIDTVLGEDVLLLERLEVEEGINRLFTIQARVRAQRDEVRPDEIVGTAADLALTLADGSQRVWNGLVTELHEGPIVTRGARQYALTLRPRLWLMSQRSDCRIFLTQSTLEVIETLCAEHGIRDYTLAGVTRPPQKRDYVVQWNETDLAYLLRRLEEEGHFFWFRHERGKHTLVVGDHPSAYDGGPATRVRLAFGSSDAEHIHDWRRQLSFTPGRRAGKDYEFLTPNLDLAADTPSIDRVPENTAYELYEYPARALTREAGEWATRLRVQATETGFDRVEGRSSVRTLAAGSRFTPYEVAHPTHVYPAQVITQLLHRAEDPTYESGAGTPHYENAFTTLPADRPATPHRAIPRPRIDGLQIALIAGPPGEEIHTDAFGRIKLQFPWDRRARGDGTDTGWVRVTQSWGGTNWGQQIIPRVGMEALVAYQEGDPDRPIVVGIAPNPNNPVPYELPAHKTKLVVRSNTYKGRGYNEISMEDVAGAENLFTHAQKDMTTKVLNDATARVDANQVGSVGANHSFEVGNNQNQAIGGSRSLTVGAVGGAASAALAAAMSAMSGQTAGLLGQAMGVAMDAMGAASGDGGAAPVDAGALAGPAGAGGGDAAGDPAASALGALATGFGGLVGSGGIGGLIGAGIDGTRAGINDASVRSMRTAGGAGMAAAGTALAGQVGGMMGGLGGVMNTMVTRFQNSTTGIASTEQVGVSKVVNVGQTMRENVGKAHTHTVGEQYVIEVGQEMLVKVGEVFRIVVGDSTLTMDKDGNVTITGKTFTTDFSDQVKHWGKVIDLNPSR